MADTLVALGEHMADRGQRLDAIIVSGDITDKGNPLGFSMLPNLLDKLGEARPVEPRRIVVLPGNHDIQLGSQPGSAARYQHFLELVRREQYTAPPIEGHDIQSDGAVIEPKRHYVLDTNAGWLIVPINCADRYGIYEAISPEFSNAFNSLISMLDDPDQRLSLEEGIATLRFRDVARVSPLQFKALRLVLRDADHEARATGDVLIRIAAIHHHLLPVTDVEEVKAFESLSNLGALRTFLAQRQIHILVHGHKHSRFAYWDHIYPPAGSPPEHRVLVLAGETVKGNPIKDEIAQVLELHSGDHAPRLALTTLPHCQTVAEVQGRRSETFDLWTDDRLPGGMTVVGGRSVDETYERLLATFAPLKPETQITNLVCEIQDGGTCARLPDAYPTIGDLASVKQRNQWLVEMVDWWQTAWPWPAGYPYFSHGGRIHRPINGLSQWKVAIDSLNNDPRSSRAIVVLIEPGIDVADAERRQFPAFTMFQLLVSGEEPELKLDVIAFFRKHEMRWWWPVNVAELHHLQLEALKTLRLKRPTLSPGRIITISAIAKVGETAPQVAIPLIDRLADEEPNRLFNLAYACFQRPARNAAAASDWQDVIADLRPPPAQTADGVPVAIRGLETLLRHLEAFAVNSTQKKERSTELIDHLRQVVDHNRLYAEKITRNDAGPAEHIEWRHQVNGRLDKALSIALRLVSSGKRAQ